MTPEIKKNSSQKYATLKTKEGKYIIQRPSRSKTEYHGNGDSAWHSTKESINNHKIEYFSIRYGYRWHKTHVYFDGIRLLSAKDYIEAEKLLNGEENE